ncbi:MAG: fasciclin domain-containing protein [Pseudomonadota bacterium]
MKNTFLKFVFVALAATGLVSQSANAQMTIADAIASNDSLNTLESLVNSAGLDAALGGGQYVVFAPTDAAFGNLGTLIVEDADGMASTISAVDLVTSDPALLHDLLGIHVVPNATGAFTTLAAAEGMRVWTLPGIYGLAPQGWPVLVKNGRFGGANVVGSPIMASNGMIYIVDDVVSTPDCPVAPNMNNMFNMVIPCLDFFDLGSGFRDSVLFGAVLGLATDAMGMPMISDNGEILFGLKAFVQVFDEELPEFDE